MNGCHGSGMFQAFSDHVLHRLQIPLQPRIDNKIRITFLVRRTKYRQILNLDELVDELRENDNFHVTTVSYERFKRKINFHSRLLMVANVIFFY